MTERNWRDEFEEKDKTGDRVLDVWYRNGEAIAYIWVGSSGKEYVDINKGRLIPKPKPATYRPYKRGEVRCGDVFRHKNTKSENLITRIEEGPCVSLGGATIHTEALLEAYTHLDGTPAGVKE